MYKYPYGDSQQLNLDWIIAKIKDMEAAEASDLETISKALISLPYNTTTSYRRYDYAFLNGKLYRCLTDTSGVFNPTAWQEALIGDDLAVLTRWINAIDAAAVVDVKFDTTGTNGKIQQKYHEEYHDVVEVDYTPVQNSKRPLSSNAGYVLNGAITSVENGLAIISDNNTHAAIGIGQYVYIKNHGTLAEGLYKNITSAVIPQNYTLSSTNVTAISNGGLNNLLNNGTFFAEQSRSADLTSGALRGVCFKDFNVVIIFFYAGASTSFGVNTLFTVPAEYFPKSQTDGAGAMVHTDNTMEFGNVRIKTDGTVINAATTNCKNCFGIIAYQLY